MHIFLIGLNKDFARSVARYVGTDERVVLCGVAPELAIAAIMLPATKAALVIVDWSVLGVAPDAGMQLLRASCKGVRIVCVMDHAKPYRDQALAAGADAVISQERFAAEFEQMLTQLDGSKYV